jgi:hypothetical protein
MNMPNARERTVPFVAGDGFQCNVVNVRGERTPSKGPVLLVHGAGVRANIFRAPVERTLVDELLEDVEPWQWMTALSSLAPVSSRTVRTAAG